MCVEEQGKKRKQTIKLLMNESEMLEHKVVDMYLSLYPCIP